MAPFCSSLFPGQLVQSEFAQRYGDILRNWGNLQSKWSIPLEVTVRGFALQGFIGPIYLLSPLSLLALRGPLGRRFLLAAAVFGGAYWLNLGTRFLIPALPFVAFAMVLAVRTRTGLLAILAVFSAVTAWPWVAGMYCDRYAWRLSEFPIKAALRLEPEEHFLGRRLPEWQAIQYMNSQLPPSAKVYSLAAVPAAYFRRDVIVADYSAFGGQIHDGLLAAHLDDFRPSGVVTLTFQPVYTKRLRIRRAKGDSGTWGVFEVEMNCGKQQVTRSNAWTIRAEPNPYAAIFAFDRNPVTRWRTEYGSDRDMHLEVAFGRTTCVSEVILSVARAHTHVGAVIEVLNESSWVKPEAAVRVSRGLPPDRLLKKAATDRLRASGITHLMLPVTNEMKDDFVWNDWQWGVRKIHESGGWMIFEVY
ncbi:MAG: hypothetical protein IT163_17840 [Bryobacterales bacterium]|nr:hypothetical protein [Bryobacterales bacterium]